jgi:tetratricopeptide (TPR) repeat protein
MGYPGRKTWVLAAGALLGLAIVLAVARGRNRLGADELAAATRTALKNKQWSRSETLLKQLSERRIPTGADIALRAELELGRGHVEEAVRLLTGIPDTDPAAAAARLVAGQIENSRDRARPAEALFLDALRLDPKLGPARRELIFLYGMQARRADVNAQFRALAQSDALDFDDVFLWTTTFEDLWINDSIRPHLERYLAADPEDRLSRLALAAVALRAGNPDESEALLRPLPDSDADARVLRARLALARSQPDQARGLVAHGPVEHVGLALLRAQIAALSNDPTAAARQFRIALRLDPANPQAIHGLPLVLKQLGDEKGAAAAQKQVEQWRNLANLLQRTKIADLRNDKDALAQLGEACAVLGQNAEARAWYRLALNLDPLDEAIQKSLYRVRDLSRE